MALVQHPATPRRWSDVAADPMDPAAIAYRRGTLRRARRPSVTDRVDYLRSLAAGRRVLDIGVVDHNLDSNRQERWLHGELASVAAECLGVDILVDEVDRLRARGYEVRTVDVTKESLDRRFEVVVCGEVIEHVGDPGSLLDAARSLLEPAGRFVVTTPNPYALRRVVQHLRDRAEENVDHVTLIGPWGIAELAERAGLVVDAYRGVEYGPADGRAGVFRHARLRKALRISDEAACDTIVYEIVQP